MFALISLVAADAAAAQTVCRPTTLRGTACYAIVEPPPPRPPFRSLGRRPEPVLPAPTPVEPSTRFVPARETERLGSTVTDRPVRGVCRPDQLGNLNCR